MNKMSSDQHNNSIRIASLDYLRGLMALSVMVYHYTVWSGVELASDSLLSKLGIYAVAIFYILSGLSLSVVYKGRINSATDVAQFCIRRVFRIAPLFWLTIFSVLLLGYMGSMIKGESFHIDGFRLFLNLSLLFGFFDPTAYLSTGAWSIGNEIVFYTVFPILFLLSTLYRMAIPITLVVSLALGATFSSLLIEGSGSLVSQWAIYINPLNQLFFFLGGIAIGVYAQPTNRRLAVGIAVVASAVFLLFSMEGDRVGLVSGLGRFVLSMCCIAFVWATYVVKWEFEGALAKMLSFFGEGCYSIYLMHPLVALPVVFVANRIGVGHLSAYCVAAAATLLISWLTFRFIERPMIRLGSRVAKSLQTRQGLSS